MTPAVKKAMSTFEMSMTLLRIYGPIQVDREDGWAVISQKMTGQLLGRGSSLHQAMLDAIGKQPPVPSVN